MFDERKLGIRTQETSETFDYQGIRFVNQMFGFLLVHVRLLDTTHVVW